MSTGRPPDRGLVAGQYRVLEPLDERGRVLKAHDRRHRRIVAIRILGASASRQPGAPPASTREIEAIGRLKHPNVVAALEVGEDRGRPYVVMPLVEGTDLDRLVRERGPLPLGQAIDVLIQAARGLGAGHDAGVLHQALRPSKLLVDAKGVVRILGLGLTRLAAPASPDALSPGGRPAGDSMDAEALDFSAPEQAEDPRRADQRADIYSLGCILYFLLIGRPPSAGETISDPSAANPERPAPRLCVLRPDAPTALEDLYRQMMARRPEDRPASMEEVLDRLESCKASIGDSPAKGAVVPEPSRTRSSVAGRSKARSPGPRDGNDPAISTRGDEAEGLPIGPEFSLEGLGLDVRPRSASRPSPGPPSGRAIRLPLAETGRLAPADRPGPLRVGRPPIILGLVVFGVLGAFALGFLLSSGSRKRTDAPAAVTGQSDRLAPARPIDRETAVNPPPPPEPEWTWRTIFDGKSPEGWMLTNRRPLPRKHVQPDGLNPHGTGSYLVVYEQKLGDFILDFDYKLSKGCNSGVFLRVGDLDDPVNTGIEVSLQDSAGTGDEDPGAIFGLVAPSANAQKPAGQWNHMTITARGPVIAVTLNGMGVSRIDLDEWIVAGKRLDGSAHHSAKSALARVPRRGYLGFQDLTGDCWLRQIVLRAPASS